MATRRLILVQLAQAALRAQHLPLWLTLGLLGRYPHPPALDWPQHTAVAGILVALWQGDPCVTAHYAFNLQPTPYHLLYLVLTPATWALGARWGSALTLMAMATCTHLGLRAWARALKRPSWACVVSPLLFFSASFAWGFGPTMMGLGPALFALAGCTRLGARPNGRDAGWTGVWGALSVAAHGVFLPGVLLGLLPLLLRRRKACVRAAFIAAAVIMLPVLPLGVRAMGSHTGAAVLPELTFETAATGWNHLRMYFAAFDRGLSRNVHQSLVAGLLATILWRAKTLGRAEREVLAVAVCHLALLWLVPLNIALRPAPAWLLNARYLPLFVAGVWLVALPAQPGLARRPRQQALGRAAAVAVMLAYVGGVAQVFARFDEEAQHTALWAQALPPGTVLGPSGGPQKFDDAWPPLARHLPSAWVPHPICAHGNLFVGGHLPIRLRDPVSLPANGQRSP